MIYKKFKLLSWNCRGLGDLDKCLVVRNVIRSSRCDVVCLQETKLNNLDCSYASAFLPSFFVKQCAFIDAIGTSGGCVIAWKKNYILLSSWATMHTITVLLLQSNFGRVLLITNVYGPSRDEEMAAFIQEFRSLSDHISHPWLLVGDFNLVRWLVDRSGDMRGFGLMSEFNEFIMDLALIDIPLKNRTYTWSNKRPQPTFSKLDRVFITQDWSVNFTSVNLSSMEVIVSDHAPLLLNCKKSQPISK
ncbi:uncharacterized protein LOC144568675 [Carex rostrata]